jgi:hypothetical protein
MICERHKADPRMRGKEEMDKTQCNSRTHVVFELKRKLIVPEAKRRKELIKCLNWKEDFERFGVIEQNCA